MWGRYGITVEKGGLGQDKNLSYDITASYLKRPIASQYSTSSTNKYNGIELSVGGRLYLRAKQALGNETLMRRSSMAGFYFKGLLGFSAFYHKYPSLSPPMTTHALVKLRPTFVIGRQFVVSNIAVDFFTGGGYTIALQDTYNGKSIPRNNSDNYQRLPLTGVLGMALGFAQ